MRSKKHEPGGDGSGATNGRHGGLVGHEPLPACPRKSSCVSGADGPRPVVRNDDPGLLAGALARLLLRAHAIVARDGTIYVSGVIDITTYHTDLARQLETAVKARKEVMRPPHPSWTAVGITALASPEGMTEVRVIAKLPSPK